MNHLNLYTDFLKKFVKPKRPMRVVFDCSNGTTGIVLKELFQASGVRRQASRIKPIFINEKPDGNFPAHGPNPMAEGAMDDLKKAVRARRADLGVIFDADGDRVFFVDNLGREIHPDLVAALISKNFKGPAILDIRNGYLAHELISADKKKIYVSRVGHYFIKKMMRAKKISFAAELSGHYYFKIDGAYFDAAILASIYLINAVTRLKKGIREWINGLPKYYRSGELNFEVGYKEGVMRKVEEFYKNAADGVSKLDGLKMEFSIRKALARGKRSRNTKAPTRIAENGAWWFSLRPSNTENLLRLNLEAKDRKVFDKRLPEIKRLLK